MYITLNEYAALYEAMDEQVFNRLNMEATRAVDRYTTGIDNVKKLKIAFPADEDDAAAVKFCIAKVIAFLAQVQKAEESANSARGYEDTGSGIRGRVITSVSAGNESVSYGTVNSASAVDQAVQDRSAREKILRDMIAEELSGLTDANGVNLLYMGRYPYVP